uniref:Uncharacterized protein n=1 Tax=Sphaerodactylus townsendi TaxID=933632 RepID=A0ACB8ETJ8_9SAUR
MDSHPHGTQQTLGGPPPPRCGLGGKLLPTAWGGGMMPNDIPEWKKHAFGGNKDTDCRQERRRLWKDGSDHTQYHSWLRLAKHQFQREGGCTQPRPKVAAMSVSQEGFLRSLVAVWGRRDAASPSAPSIIFGLLKRLFRRPNMKLIVTVPWMQSVLENVFLEAPIFTHPRQDITQWRSTHRGRGQVTFFGPCEYTSYDSPGGPQEISWCF